MHVQRATHFEDHKYTSLKNPFVLIHTLPGIVTRKFQMTNLLKAEGMLFIRREINNRI